MLVGRDAELDRMRRLVARGGGALLLHGQAGIGKTALLEEARSHAGPVTVLQVRGIESESSLAFAALRDLVRPVVGLRETLPGPQRAALEGALALAAPAPGDRLAVCVATLGVLEAAAPLLVLVDDLQWLDEPSRECVLYAARRAEGEIVFLLTERDTGPNGAHTADLPALDVGPLDADASDGLIEHVAPDLTPGVRTAVAAAAGGYPLALVELPTTLSAAQRAGTEPLAEPLAPLNGLRRVFADRVRALPERAAGALLVAAACQTDELAPILAAGRALDLGVADLQAAEEAGLVTLGPERIAFSHPLVRGGIYHEAPAQARRDAHRALAEVVEDESRAWHLAAAAVGPDEQAAQALEQAAGIAAARRAYAVAADAMERAARLSPEAAAAVGRLTGAAASALSAGNAQHAGALADEAFDRAGDPLARAAAEHLRGLLAVWGGRVNDGMEILERAAGGMAANPPMAALVLADAAFACSAAGHCGRALALAEQAASLIDETLPATVRAPVLAVLSWSLVMRGRSKEARPVIEEVERLFAEIDPHSPTTQLILTSVNARLPFEAYERSLEEGRALAQGARDAGSLFALPSPIVNAAISAWLLGRWEGLEDEFAEAIAAAEETGQWGPATLARSIRTRLRAVRGHEDEAREDATRVLALAEAADALCFNVYGHYALGLIALSAGHVDDAIESLVETGRLALASELMEPILIPWAPDLIEAYVRAGREDEARDTLATLEQQAEGADTNIARAIAERCHGLMAAEEFDAPFARALDLHDSAEMPFERARTLLAYGMRLHRARRRVDARERLREAAAVFEELGAAPWASLAAAELRAAGGRQREGLGDALSPQEERVAQAAARGATTREIAAELYLAPKTIEFHLGRIYRKLGVRSRAGLATALTERAPPSPSAPPADSPSHSQ